MCTLEYVLLRFEFSVSLHTGNQKPSQFKSLDFIHSDSFVVCTAFSRLVQLVTVSFIMQSMVIIFLHIHVCKYSIYSSVAGIKGTRSPIYTVYIPSTR